VVVLVTGCSSGFGARIARMARAQGHVVYAGLRDLSQPRELGGAEDDGIRRLQLDVTSAADRGAAIARIVEEAGGLDVLVNNAGAVLGGFVETLEEAELRHVFEVNLFGTWALTKAALPALRRSRGLVVNLSSISGLRAFGGLGAYSASKFALEGLTEAMAQELEALGVRVALVEPGSFQTDIWTRNKVYSDAVADPDSPYAGLVPALDAAFCANEVGAGDPDQVAAAVVALFTDPAPPLRRVLWGTRRSRLIFARMSRRMQLELPQEP
jgi:NAD(P)-dependent dehydrogenase (short-subunit alcohol dehydrogenase family)